MRADDFLSQVVEANIYELKKDFGNYRAAVNAILALDAFFGMRFNELKVADHPSVKGLKMDDEFRDWVAARSETYALLRDAAAALKHGALNRGTKSRMLRLADAVERQSVSQHGSVNAVMIEYEDEHGKGDLVADYALWDGLTVARNILRNPDWKPLFKR